MANFTLSLGERSWKEVAILPFIIGLCFGFLVMSNMSNSANEASPTELAAFGSLGSRGTLPTFSGQRTQFRGAMMPGMFSSPLEQLAITAIEANYHGNRDVSANAKFRSAWESMGASNKEKLSKMVVRAEVKAQDLPGVTAPLDFFDPIGYTATATQGKLLFYREVELKHGRVAMLAALGFLVGENFHPLFGGNIDVPAIYAFQETPLETFWPAVVAAIAIPELFSVFTFNDPSTYTGGGPSLWTIKDDHQPGDLGFDPLGLKPTDPEEFKEMQTKELNNGRLAMIAAAGMIAQELATGQKLF